MTQQVERGVVFPPTADGGRSTTATGKAIWAAAVQPLLPALAARIEGEKQWRQRYVDYVTQVTALGLESAESALTIARSGLAAAYRHFQYIDHDGTTHPLAAAPSAPPARMLHTARVVGSAPPGTDLAVPYRGSRLVGARLQQQLDDWVARGIVEPGHHDAVLRVRDHPDRRDLRGQTFVLLGAAAEMGPTTTLLDWGATVVAVELPRPALWEQLIAYARASAGTLVLPVRAPVGATATDQALAHLAGADLLRETPAIAAWLGRFDGPLTLGCYAYLDGGDHVRVVLAMDVLAQALAARPDPLHLAFLLTPTDVMAVPPQAAQMAQARSQGGVARAVRRLTGGRMMATNVRQMVTSGDGATFGLVDNQVVQQGPNYSLAKRLQQWRAVVARADGHVVSCNVAPATYTRSVTANRLFRIAYAGAETYGVEVFAPETTNALLTAPLIDDLTYPQSAARPTTALHHPAELFMAGANHGGMWRMPYQVRSMLPVTVVIGAFRQFG